MHLSSLSDFNLASAEEDGQPVFDGDCIKWFRSGQLHREDGPALEQANGTKEWRRNGKMHREGGPAREEPGFGNSWFINGRLHREDGPAIERANGLKMWMQRGVLHREDGPAIEDPDEGHEWWFNGEPWPEGPAVVAQRENAERQRMALNKPVMSMRPVRFKSK